MKISHCAILLSVSTGCNGYLPSLSHRASVATKFLSVRALQSSTTGNDAAFSAFADSLEKEPEAPSNKSAAKEKPWQSKLEDLLDPKTNLAERQILLSELLNSNEQIRESVMDAMASKKVRLELKRYLKS
jgi:hypothetical protein